MSIAAVLILELLTAPKARPADLRPHVTVVTPSERYEGRLESEDRDTVVIDVGKGRLRSVWKGRNNRVTVEDRYYEGAPGEAWFKDPARTRYVVSPSGHRLRPGEFSWTQLELLGSLFTIGASERVTLLFGTLAPAWFVPSFTAIDMVPTINLLVGASWAQPLADDVRLSVGSWAYLMPFHATVASWNYLGLTLGNEERHATFTAGMAGLSANGTQNLGTPTLSAATSLRVAEHVALLGEGWAYLSRSVNGFGLGPSSVFAETTLAALAASLAVRFLWAQWSLDVGVLVVAAVGSPLLNPTLNGALPVPVVSFAYHSR